MTGRSPGGDDGGGGRKATRAPVDAGFERDALSEGEGTRRRFRLGRGEGARGSGGPISQLRDLLAWQGRLQRSTRFKAIASIVLVLGAIAAAVTYTIVVTAPSAEGPGIADSVLAEEARVDRLPEGAEALPGKSRSAIEATLERVDRIRTAREDKAHVALAAVAVLALALMVVWLGLGLTYAELLLAAWLIAYPLGMLGGLEGLSRLLLGTVALAGAFTAMIEGVRLAFGALPGSVFAVARNTVVEALRMKVSVVFIVLLIFGLAALPGVLNEESPLRYRVQSFLQYGTGGSFWVIAILTLFFSAATVAFEQRDRQIWQTMTKPVASWQYILGKWLGVAAVSATLLAVATSGVFLFTEYLRTQPAAGEEARQAAGILAPSEDREILETQVLVARTSIEPDVPPEVARDGAQFQAGVEQYIERQRLQSPDFAKDPAQRARVESDLYRSIFQAWRTIEPGQGVTFEFTGLERASETNAPIILRYRVDSGSNAPDQMFTLTFRIQGQPWVTRETGLGHPHTMTVAPIVQAAHAGHWHAILMDDPAFYGALERGLLVGPDDRFVLPPGLEFKEPSEVIETVWRVEQNGQRETFTRAEYEEEFRIDPPRRDRTIILPGRTGPSRVTRVSRLRVDVINADQESGRPNPGSVMLPAGTLELTYVVGSYRMNYLRAVTVLWLKLAFLSILALACATFLSFPVACLVAFGTFLAAESAGFLGVSLQYYDATTTEGDVVLYKVLVRAISLAVTGVFQIYAGLKPTTHLVDGELIPWGHVARAAAVLGAWSGVLYGIGVAMFRRRELAVYSGA